MSNYKMPDGAAPERVCSNCQAFARNFEHEHFGECRRHAPKVFYSDEAEGPDQAWPEVLDMEWCLEFVPLPGAAFKGYLADDASVNQLDLSNRALNCLQNAELISVGALCAAGRYKLYKTRNCGKHTIAEIEMELLRHGRKLTDNVES